MKRQRNSRNYEIRKSWTYIDERRCVQLLANRVVNRAANLNPLGKRPYIFFGCFVFVSPIVYLSWPGLMSNRPLEKETKQNMGKESHLLQLSKSKCVMALWRKKNKKTGVCCHVFFFFGSRFAENQPNARTCDKRPTCAWPVKENPNAYLCIKYIYCIYIFF